MCLGEDGCLHYHVNPGKLPPWLGGGWAWAAGLGAGCSQAWTTQRLGRGSAWNPQGPIKKDNGVSPLV